MTAPLQHTYRAINAEAFLRAWLLPIVTTSPAAAGIGSKLWAAGMPKPYRAVRRIAGPRECDSDYPLMRVHTFGADYTLASRAADDTDSRIMVLEDYPGWNTTMPDSSVAHCDWIEITEASHEEPYGAETAVIRFVSEYRLGISFVPA